MSFLCAAVSLLSLLPRTAHAQVTPVSFKTSDGWTIKGSLKAGRGQPVAVLVHGAGSSRNEWESFAAELWKRGVGTLALDLRGHGESVVGPAGKQEWTSFEKAAEWTAATADLDAAVRFLAGRGFRKSRIGFIGASIGSNLAALASGPESPWLVLLSPGLDYRGVALTSPRARRVLAAASAQDPYAYQASLALKQSGTAFFETARGHGVEMFKDAEFQAKVLAWIEASR
ncbi:MAG: alpha/beta fold hydrolase [Elusimicrobia bacterium]|nr:alpha/beta fold hydrolase [Elusimicrobiota bacterium]